MAAGWARPDYRRAAGHLLSAARRGGDSFEGDMATALRHFDAGREALAPYAAEYPDLRAKAMMLGEAAGVALMRQGEVENCLVMASADRCIFPLRSRRRAPSRRGRSRRLRALRAARGCRRPTTSSCAGCSTSRQWCRGATRTWCRRRRACPAAMFAADAQVPRLVDVAGRGEARSHEHCRRHHCRRLRQRRPGRRRDDQRRFLHAGPPLSQSRRRHLRGPHRGGRPGAAARGV